MEVRLSPGAGVRPGAVALVPGVERICVLKATALGDFVQALPALEALRRAYPSARISLLGREWHAELLAGRRSPVDDVLPVPHGAIGDEAIGDRPRERERFLASVAGRFDLALQMHGGGRHSNPFVRHLGARVTAGARTPDAGELDRWLAYDVNQHEILRNLEIASLVGATAGPVEPALAVTQADLDASLGALPADPRPLAVVHPGATDPRRRWPAEHFARVADALAAAGARVVVTGIAEERAIADRVLAAARAPLVDLSGRLSLGGLVGLLARSGVLVSNDTGPRHIAAAVGAPTAAVYWVGNVITAGPLTRGWDRIAVSWRIDCPERGMDCMEHDCGHTASFVSDVPVEQVVSDALELFEGYADVHGSDTSDAAKSLVRQ